MRYYREQMGLFCCNGVLSNVESHLRGNDFVTQKIITSVKNLSKGSILLMGNINSEKDWVHASDVAKAAWLILQQKNPDDYIISSGENHSVKEFINTAYSNANIKIEWVGDGLNEIGIDKNSETLVMIEPNLFRKYENNNKSFIADNTKLKSLGWEPRYDLNEIIREMIYH
jgi:GDPmannose 4,6-dehydratase